MRIRDVYVESLGTFLPEPVSVGEAVAQGWYPAEEAAAGGWLSAGVAGDIEAPEMGLRAARQAFDRSALTPGSIDLLLYPDCWHQGPEGWHPQYHLQRQLAMDDALAVELKHGCTGMFSALRLAVSHLAAGADDAAALLVTSDNYGTPLLDRWRQSAEFIMGDGACALTLTQGPGFAELVSLTMSTIPEAEELHRCGEPLFPPTVTTGRPLNFASRIDAFKQKVVTEGLGSLALFKIQKTLVDCVGQALEEAGTTLDEVAWVMPNNASKEQTEVGFLTALGLPLSRSTWEYGRTIGHTGAGDQFFSLAHLLSTGQLSAGDHVLMFGVAPGVTISAAVFKINDIPDWARR
ncbi:MULTISPECIES: ketoacyl-ACP synthase III family protein [unclassified Streptomyces]|uniref:ketoacyl-ACP synthase III family protein n=1 Tax=unclassified Streptomyces TaxID=2593676 RepID=UPI002DD9BA97|nr:MULTISPECIES: ketoacyl-ACP synthase III family protein [unclassified Streptomyces]WSA95915.1 ketoacyl-ACP synthase III family protein [Streptomyces sp. NBC_01795]WSB80330.1 ketoacyl-ACP synthase III family protein [Streptomyces sp. NBC_01775]WSS11459.1 ketoacyl-ACP synthase III family protein [Streptomyces sp. NBC_01186]WSS40173.1 ketoacyl-ACP synthase III family protein [Streptomyces sp. NBC_01187]